MKPQQKTIVGLWSFHQVEWEGVERLVVPNVKCITSVCRMARGLKRDKAPRQKQWAYVPESLDDENEDVCAHLMWWDNYGRGDLRFIYAEVC
jgi:hypothetical protein